MLDKAEFPRLKACAGGLTMKTVRAIRYSIEPVVRQSIGHMMLEERDSSRIPVRSRKTICVMTERSELDAFCLAKTIEAGAIFHQVQGITAIDERSDEVIVTTQNEALRGRFLVGADGVNSQVRRMTNDGPWFSKAFAIEANIPRHSVNEDLVFDFAPVTAGYGWVFPKRDHINVGLYTLDQDDRLNRSRLSAYIAVRFGDDARPEKFVGQHAGFGAAQHRVERNRIFLVGDAGGFVDMLTGEGIYGAVISGQAAAKAILFDLKKKAPARESFVHFTENLRQNLGIAGRIATSFYANPQRGFRAMKMPLLRSAILKGYADGLNLSALVKTARRLLPERA